MHDARTSPIYTLTIVGQRDWKNRLNTTLLETSADASIFTIGPKEKAPVSNSVGHKKKIAVNMFYAHTCKAVSRVVGSWRAVQNDRPPRAHLVWCGGSLSITELALSTYCRFEFRLRCRMSFKCITVGFCNIERVRDTWFRVTRIEWIMSLCVCRNDDLRGCAFLGGLLIFTRPLVNIVLERWLKFRRPLSVTRV